MLLTIEVHSELSPTLAGVHATDFSMPLSTLYTFCSTWAASGHLFMIVRHSDSSNASLGYQSESKSRDTLLLVVYHESVHISAKPLEDQNQIFFFFNWTLVVIILMRWRVCLLWTSFTLVGYSTYSMLLKICHCALCIRAYTYTSPLSVQALQSRWCLSYSSYATMVT
jgi:hypothetical protein